MRTSEAPTASSLAEQLPEEWERTIHAWGEPRYRALQIFRWIHQRGVFDPALMSDLPKRLRDKLAQEGLVAPSKVAELHQSADGTQKLLIEFNDGKRVETVLIPRGAVAAEDIFSSQGDDDLNEGALPGSPTAHEVTQCVSSQVGCAMGCAFCASGIAGLKRNMSAAEIVSQVFLGRTALGVSDGAARLSGLVFMGMGEPLHNYDAVTRSLRLLSHPEGLGMSLRRMTVSTSGLVREIDQLAKDFGGQVQLAVSVHASDTATRTRLMPVNKKHPLPELIQAIRRYPVPRRRRLTIEYTLVRDINDSVVAAQELARLLTGLRAKVNLIPMNTVEGSGLRAPDDDVVERFQRVLRDAGLDTFLRKRKGDDIAAACGQLALHGESRKVKSEFA